MNAWASESSVTGTHFPPEVPEPAPPVEPAPVAPLPCVAPVVVALPPMPPVLPCVAPLVAVWDPPTALLAAAAVPVPDVPLLHPSIYPARRAAGIASKPTNPGWGS